MPDLTDPNCPYMRRLNEMMALHPLSVVPDMEVVLFREPQAFEVEAREAGAPRETLGAIAKARSSVGSVKPRHWIPVPRGH